MSVKSRKVLLAGGFANIGGGTPVATLQAANTLPSVYRESFTGSLVNVNDTTALLVGKGYSAASLQAMTLTLDGSGGIVQSGVTALTGMIQTHHLYGAVYDFIYNKVFKIDSERYIIFTHSYNTSTYAGVINVAVLTLSTMAIGNIVTINMTSIDGIGHSTTPSFDAEQIDSDTYLVTHTAGTSFAWSKVSVSGTTVSKTSSAAIASLSAIQYQYPFECTLHKTDTPNKYIFRYGFINGSTVTIKGAVLTFNGSAMSPASASAVIFSTSDKVKKVATNLWVANSGFYFFDGSVLSRPTALTLVNSGAFAPFAMVGSTFMHFETRLSNYKLYNADLSARQLTQLVDNDSNSNVHTVDSCITLGSNVLAVGSYSATSFGYALYEII